VAAGDEAHRGIGITGESRLKKRRIKARHDRGEARIDARGSRDLGDRPAGDARRQFGRVQFNGHGRE